MYYSIDYFSKKEKVFINDVEICLADFIEPHPPPMLDFMVNNNKKMPGVKLHFDPDITIC